MFISGVPTRYGMADITWAEYCVGLIVYVVGALAGPGTEATAWEDCVGPLTYALEVLAGPVVPALGNGAPIFKRVVGARSSRRVAGRDSSGESAAPRHLLDNHLTIIRARANSSASPYMMRRDD